MSGGWNSPRGNIFKGKMSGWGAMSGGKIPVWVNSLDPQTILMLRDICQESTYHVDDTTRVFASMSIIIATEIFVF